MKNVILGIISVFMVIYLMLISMNVYLVVTETNKMERKISRSVTNCLEGYYKKTDAHTQAVTQLKEELLLGEKEDKVEINIRAIDLEKGVLSVTVNKTITLVTGEDKTITLEKTAIMERVDVNQPHVFISFFCGEQLYKQYELTVGEVCPLPKLPDGTYGGWIEYGNETEGLVYEIGPVFENKTYHAKKN